MRIFVTTLLFLLHFLVMSADGQSRSVPRPLDLRAQALAAEFFNRFEETGDVSSLIKTYFVADFAKRLVYCRRTVKCGGANRDFWTEREFSEAQNLLTDDEVFRQYVTTINLTYLGSRMLQYLTVQAGNDPADLGKLPDELLKMQLKNRVGKDSLDLVEDLFSGNGNTVESAERTQASNKLRGYEQLVRQLRLLERSTRNSLTSAQREKFRPFRPSDFRYSSEIERNGFFDLPQGSKIIEIWPDKLNIPFKIDMIERANKLKIIAIYPPLD
jgi:hypothetical protein